MIARLQPIFRTVLQDPTLRLTPDLAINQHEGWDSLSNITLMLELEAAFGVQFSADEIVHMTSVAAIIAKLEELGA